MSASLIKITVGPEHITLSSSCSITPPKKSSSKEVMESNTEEAIDNTPLVVPILSDTQCYIGKDFTVNWLTIKDVFTSKSSKRI